MEFNKEKFEELYELDLTKYIEKLKYGSKADYISWANAYRLLMEHDHTAITEVIKAEDGLPYFSRDKCHMVFTRVTAFGTTKEMHLAIMNGKFQAVEQPTGTDVSNSLMRCLTKNIALFGIGLKIYAKDDPNAFVETSEDAFSKYAILVNKKDIDKEKFAKFLKESYGCENIMSVSQLEKEDIEAINNMLSKKEDRPKNLNIQKQS